ISFPSIVWYEVEYSVYTMRQASRRSWRIGATNPVMVFYMAYRNTLQAEALKLVAKKLQSSLAVEGELPEEGLAAFGDDGDDLMLALAKRIVHDDRDHATDNETVEAMFARARTASDEAERLLVDDQPEKVIPAAVAAARASEAQSESLSWEQFINLEPPRRRGRRRVAVPVMNLFEWAMKDRRSDREMRTK
ncbi:MAG: hypothetical protein HY682_01945, partial [Chloroflexi bacterium]|nr:hypothetical protein [Chloroflexota bacterium]